MSDVMTVGKKLVELCQQGKGMEAMETLYSPHIVSDEPHAGGPMAQRIAGIEGVKDKTRWWEANHTVHSATVDGPYPHGNRFIVRFKYDVTHIGKQGPMAGKRFTMDEAALYTVEHGKIVHEEFFYPA